MFCSNTKHLKKKKMDEGAKMPNANAVQVIKYHENTRVDVETNHNCKEELCLKIKLFILPSSVVAVV